MHNILKATLNTFTIFCNLCIIHNMAILQYQPDDQCMAYILQCFRHGNSMKVAI